MGLGRIQLRSGHNHGFEARQPGLKRGTRKSAMVAPPTNRGEVHERKQKSGSFKRWAS